MEAHLINQKSLPIKPALSVSLPSRSKQKRIKEMEPQLTNEKSLPTKSKKSVSHPALSKQKEIKIVQERQKIMLVDDNIANLTIGKDILESLYEVYALHSAAELFEALEKTTPDLILLDIDMPMINGYETINILKKDMRYADIPVMFIIPYNCDSIALEGLSLGAIDYVTKPFSAPLLLKRIERHFVIQTKKNELRKFNEDLLKIVKDKTKDIFELQNSIIATITDLVESRDNNTGWHIVRTQKYMELIVEQLIADGIYSEYTQSWSMYYMLPSSYLHDVGKIAISDAILNKPGKLTPEEFEIMKTHVEKGVEAIQRIEKSVHDSEYLKYAEIIAGNHHEKWDGTGYPHGLKGQDIPLEGRLMALADVYDALTSVRPYKRAFSSEEASKIINDSSGTQFDPVLVETFNKLQDKFFAITNRYSDSPESHPKT